MRTQTKTNITIGIIALVLILLCFTVTLVKGQTGNYSKEELINLINENNNIKEHAHSMAESARILGWDNEDKLIKQLQDKWSCADEKNIQYQQKLNAIIAEEQAAEAKRQKALAEAEAKRQAEIAAKEAAWSQKMTEYPTATTIWRAMKAQGWNDYVCAGIMGNMMAEVGGQTLNLRYALSTGTYYGICQWSRGYSEVWGAGLDTQINFLIKTIKYEFDTYGSKYQKGFNFNSFLNLRDCRAASLAFSKCYERCASKTYSIRQNNAVKAYNYFVN